MRTVLPGQPQPKSQALCTALWEGLRLVLYISGSALIILGGPHELLQTIYLEEHSDLDAVAIDEATGKIATCSSDEVTICKPYGRQEGAIKWSFQSSFKVPDLRGNTLTLSWGSGEELLVGYSSLRLYQTAEDNALIWNRTLPRPVSIAAFSYDANFVASTGAHDRLIKLWRRQSYGSDDTRFDFTYLPHPTAVTAIQWRKTHEHQHLIDNVLFSICADGKLRIWATTDPHALQVLQLWGKIDMQEAIQPRDLGLSNAQERYGFIIDNSDFMDGAERALKGASSVIQQENHALEHLAEISKSGPIVCVIVDRRGNMSAWGLENIGSKSRKPTDKFNIAHVENVKLGFLQDVIPEQSNSKFLSFCTQNTDSPFTLLVHHFDGRIVWYESKLDELFDPSPRQQRLHAKALWSGHDGLIKKIVRSGCGKSLISRTNDNEGLIWKQGYDGFSMALIRLSSLSCSEHIHQSCLLHEGDFVVNLHRHGVSLWDTRPSTAKQIAFRGFQSGGKPLCLLPLSPPGLDSQSSFVAVITSKMEAIVWQVDPPRTSTEKLASDEDDIIQVYCSSHLGIVENLEFVLSVDPAGSLPTAPGFLDTFAKDLVIAYTQTGSLRTWTATIDLHTNSVNWLLTSSMETGLEMPSLASGSSIRKIAVVDSAKTGVSIWDSRSSQLEYSVRYPSSDTVQDLDWSSTPDDQSILAVGFPYKVIILAQMRYDYVNAGPAWAAIREINIKELTSHPIGDSTWLGSGNLVVGAGNQLYVYDKDVSTSDDMVTDLSIPIHEHRSLSIFDLVTYLNGPLPVFHPQQLAQCILAGKMAVVQQILCSLYKTLKFFVAGDELDSFVALSPSDFYTEQEVEPMDMHRRNFANIQRMSFKSPTRKCILHVRISRMMKSPNL